MHRFFPFKTIAAFVLVSFCLWLPSVDAKTTWKAGFSRIDVTPSEPVRMSGYGNRDRPHEGVATPLHVRSMCLESVSTDSSANRFLLVSVDNIGLSGATTRELAERIESQHGIDRARVVFSSTHTHSGPDLGEQLSNIFSTPLSNEESAAAVRYREQLLAAIVESVTESITDLQPARLTYGVGEASFAANRRVISGGKWTGFGVQADGPVDHRVPLLRIVNDEGELRGVVFNYACHCTTVGGDYYQINADWAGYATTELESEFPSAVAICTIGCGADANPNPRGTEQMAQLHGNALADEIRRLLKTDLKKIDADLQSRFDYAALSFDLPTREELESRLNESRPQTRRHAEQMIRVYNEKGRLPATYPVPIQSWQFGDQLTMIFLGGEVVVDYALRLKRNLDAPDLWVSAYCNDVLGYIASERMRSEGGYEYDRSGIYYSLPGPWASGTEDLLIRRITEMIRGRGRQLPLSANDSLSQLSTSPGFRVELVASEPLVEDPVNIAFGEDGRMWVVEMGDYPEGDEGGRVKALVDQDGDGVYDHATVFLSGIDFPTGVQPWRDGILISAAPNILFARDVDQDGQADQVETLYSGFKLANPQHRINGFTYGLDHSLHLASGDNLGEIRSTKTGETLNASGHDVQIFPDQGSFAVTCGRTQFIRSRDDFGRWFGNSNSRPMFHFPIDDHYLRRNRSVAFSSNAQQLFTPATAPPVFPMTAATERFNDLFAANRFTSACSSIVARSPQFDVDGHRAAIICEPVHNLVHRAVLIPEGTTYRAGRSEVESKSEFLASTDTWFRPVRCVVGPDGDLYVVDMYREVIEHPEWIPEAWQQRLNVRAGDDKGRIYRVTSRPSDSSPRPFPVGRGASQWIRHLGSDVGPLRDLAQRVLLSDFGDETRSAIESLAKDDSRPAARGQALSILSVVDGLSDPLLIDALSSESPGVLYVATRLAEPRLNRSDAIHQAVVALADHHAPSVAMQVALTLGESMSPSATSALTTIALRDDLDRWLADSILCSARGRATTIAAALVEQMNAPNSELSESRLRLFQGLLRTTSDGKEAISPSITAALTSDRVAIAKRLQLAECLLSVIGQSDSSREGLVDSISPLSRQAFTIALDAQQTEETRRRAVSLMAFNAAQNRETIERLLSILQPTFPAALQCEAIDGLLETQTPQIATEISKRWPTLSIDVRNHLVSRLLDRQSTAELLLDWIESGDIAVNEVSLAAREQLLKTGSRSMRVRSMRLIGGNGKPSQRAALAREYVTKFRSSSTMSASERKAEIELGEKLYVKHCGTCHNSNPDGIAIGANLNNLTLRTDEALVSSILDPNRAVEPKYQSYFLQLIDGKNLVGVIETEVADSLTLAHADGKRTTVRRDEIDLIKSTGSSLMPEGFESTLSVNEIQAIVRYLQR